MIAVIYDDEIHSFVVVHPGSEDGRVPVTVLTGFLALTLSLFYN